MRSQMKYHIMIPENSNLLRYANNQNINNAHISIESFQLLHHIHRPESRQRLYESLLLEAEHLGIKRHLSPVDARSTLEGVWHNVSAAVGVLHWTGRLSADFSDGIF